MDLKLKKSYDSQAARQSASYNNDLSVLYIRTGP